MIVLDLDGTLLNGERKVSERSKNYLKKLKNMGYIIVIAYMINTNWFETEKISCPNIKEDSSYELTDNRHSITFVTKLDRDRIYEDLFKKLGV